MRKRLSFLLLFMLLILSFSSISIASEPILKFTHLLENENNESPRTFVSSHLMETYKVGHAVFLQVEILDTFNNHPMSMVQIEYGTGLKYVPYMPMLDMDLTDTQLHAKFIEVENTGNVITVKNSLDHFVRAGLHFEIVSEQDAYFKTKLISNGSVIKETVTNLNVKGQGGSYKILDRESMLQVFYTINSVMEGDQTDAVKGALQEIRNSNFEPTVEVTTSGDITLDRTGVIKLSPDQAERSMGTKFDPFNIHLTSPIQSLGEIKVVFGKGYFGEPSDIKDSIHANYFYNYQDVHNMDGGFSSASSLGSKLILGLLSGGSIFAGAAALFFMKFWGADYKQFKQMKLESHDDKDKKLPLIAYIKFRKYTYVLGSDNVDEVTTVLRKFKMKFESDAEHDMDMTEDFDFSGYKLIRLRYPKSSLKGKNNVTIVYKYSNQVLGKDHFETSSHFTNVKIVEKIS